MAFNGTGTFNRVYNWTNDKANGINITASRFDTEDSGFATGLSNCICKDGQQTTTARIPFAVGIQLNQGTLGTPALSIAGDNTTGFYQTTTGEIRFGSVAGYAATLNANGLDNTVIGGGTPAASAFTTITGTSSITLGANSGTIGSVVLKGSTSGSTTIVPNVAASGTLTLPAATDTLIGKATTDTLTNKTFDTAGTGNVLKINGTTVSATTGSGSVVLATSPNITGLSYATAFQAFPAFAATGTTQSVSTGANTLMPFGTVTFDQLSNYTNTAANYKFTAPVAGVYRVHADVTVTANAGANASIIVYKNGGSYKNNNISPGATATIQQLEINTLMKLAANDTVQIYVYQDSGGNKTFTLGEFSISWVSN